MLHNRKCDLVFIEFWWHLLKWCLHTWELRPIKKSYVEIKYCIFCGKNSIINDVNYFMHESLNLEKCMSYDISGTIRMRLNRW